MSPVVVNILDLIDMGGKEVIEHKLAAFSSPKNPEIEDFIRNKDLFTNNFSICLSFSPIALTKNQLHSSLCA